MSVFNNGVLGLKQAFENNAVVLAEIDAIEQDIDTTETSIAQVFTNATSQTVIPIASVTPELSGVAMLIGTFTAPTSGTFMININTFVASSVDTVNLLTYELDMYVNGSVVRRIYYELSSTTNPNQNSFAAGINATFVRPLTTGDVVTLYVTPVLETSQECYVEDATAGIVVTTIGDQV